MLSTLSRFPRRRAFLRALEAVLAFAAVVEVVVGVSSKSSVTFSNHAAPSANTRAKVVVVEVEVVEVVESCPVKEIGVFVTECNSTERVFVGA